MRRLSSRCLAKSMPGSSTIASRSQPGGQGERDLRREEFIKRAHDVVMPHMRVRDLGFADAVHDEQRGAMARGDAGILVGGQRAEVVEKLAARGERGIRHGRTPGVDRKHRRRERRVVCNRNRAIRAGLRRAELRAEFLDEGCDPIHFLLGGNRRAIGARAFAADVDQVRALGGHAPRLSHRGIEIERAVPRKRIGIQIDDAHDKRPPREIERALRQPEFGRSHEVRASGKATRVRCRRWKRSVWVKPAARAAAAASAKPRPISSGACESELITSSRPASRAIARN